jgi:hypothetical protein
MQSLSSVLSLVLAATTVPSGALARSIARPEARVVSAYGRHVLEVGRGGALLDGRPVWQAPGQAQVVSPPAWRRDGRAVAWVERGGGETRLVIIPRTEGPADALPWTVPAVSGDRVFWASHTSVVVGPHLLAPRAVASWTETVH